MVYPYNGHPSWTNHRCEKLARSFYTVVPGWDSNPWPLDLTLYRNTTMQQICKQGLSVNCFTILFHLIVVSKILCALFAWGGYISLDNVGWLNKVLCKAEWYGFTDSVLFHNYCHSDTLCASCIDYLLEKRQFAVTDIQRMFFYLPAYQ